MKTFQELNFKEHYDSQKDDLLNDFYIPALANSKKYRRFRHSSGRTNYIRL